MCIGVELKAKELFGDGVDMERFRDGWRYMYDYLCGHTVEEARNEFGEGLIGIAQTSVMSSEALTKAMKSF